MMRRVPSLPPPAGPGEAHWRKGGREECIMVQRRAMSASYSGQGENVYLGWSVQGRAVVLYVLRWLTYLSQDVAKL
ncbi:hypothetical protein E2C01_033512 [Portunus trituberculatus]|uniref:Uncharacterized protein n=1 Tax=Portunus trituberculatus TaxID=210409 RepID=A0A5B7F3Y0_PORTR|nr:hypothetical protein [Portunus trituberculatus]